jgi:hypothetical protein
MGKKRRLLSSKNKFGVKYSSHPRMKMILAETSAEAVIKAATPIKVPEAIVPEVIQPHIAPPATETVIEAKPEAIVEEQVSTTKPALKVTNTTVAPQKTPTKKKVTTRKTARKTTKKKTTQAPA